MTRTTLRHALLLATAATGASLGYIAPAEAAWPAVLQIHPGVGGPKEKDGGAGYEQGDAAVFTKGGAVYVVSVYMSSNVDDEDGPWQAKCTSVKMDAVLGPVVVVDQKQLTKNGGSRPANHPRIATNGLDAGVWAYGTNETNGNTRTYVQGIDEMCNLTTERLRISENNNQNENAVDLSFIDSTHFVAGYLSTANNDQDAVYAVGLNVSTGSVQKTWITKVVAPSNVGRPTIAEAGPGRAFFCASKGNNRPPEDGVECALLDANDGKIYHKQLIAKSDPANNVYFNQPSIAKLGTNLFAVQVLESNGLGKKNNIKGSNTEHLYAFKVSETLFSQEGYIKNVGKYPTHSAVCGGSYGESGANHVAVLGASPTGLGQPSVQFVQWNVASFKVNADLDNWTMGFVGDSGLIANLYGHNPNTQGRDFLRCIGNVPNPGHGVKDGYMPEVKTFFVAPHAGNVPGDPKNSGYLSFIPGTVSKAIVPEAPKEQPKKGLPPSSGSGGTGGTGGTDGTGGTGGGNGGSGANDGNAGAGNVDIPARQSCAISTSGTGSSSEGFAFLALGIGALFAARRRR